MRVVVDRGTAALRLEVGETGEARSTSVAEGVAVLHDAAGRIAGVELRGVDPAALDRVTVELGGLAERPSGASSRPPAAAAPQPTPPPHTGPLSWDPEAEAAMEQVPFFSRGRHRLAASALARRQGLDRVTVDIVRSIGR